MSASPFPVEPATSRARSRPRLLIVDDNADIRLLVRIAIADSTLNAEVDQADSLQQAHEKLRQGWHAVPQALPDLVLMDLNLGDGSGHDLLAAMKSDPRLAHISVAMFSTSSDPLDRARSLRFGAVRHIVKPLGYDELVEAMNGLAALLAPKENAVELRGPAETPPLRIGY